MSALATRSDAGVDADLAAVEAELRACGRVAFATCEALRSDPRLDGLEPCLRLLGCAVFAADPDAPPIPRRRRVQACRLMLLALGAHGTAPRWTPLQLEQVVESALQLPGAELGDLVHAQFTLLGEARGPITQAQASFARALAAQLAGKRRQGHADDDLVWIVVRLADPVLPHTQAQAYFAAHVLPPRLRARPAALLLRTLGDSPLAVEVRALLGVRG